MSDQYNVQWTSKVWIVAISIAFFILGAVVLCWEKSKVGTITGVLLLSLGFAFLGYSTTIKQWCIANHKSAFSSGLGGSFGGCLRKGYMEF